MSKINTRIPGDDDDDQTSIDKIDKHPVEIFRSFDYSPKRIILRNQKPKVGGGTLSSGITTNSNLELGVQSSGRNDELLTARKRARYAL